MDVTIATHDSRFHSDDVFAIATLTLLLDDGRTGIEVVRSREEEDIEKADYVVDVGGKYDPAKKLFDHHQLEMKDEHAEGLPYAAFGLVWKEYGEKLTGSKEASEIVEQKLVVPLDAMDNGVLVYDTKFENVHPYDFSYVIDAFSATWKEEDIDSDFHYDNMFKKVLALAVPILEREIMRARAIVEGVSEVEKIYEEAEDKRIIVSERNYPFQHVLYKYPEPLYIVNSNLQNDTWAVRTVRTDPTSFVARKFFPKEWAGLRDEDLAKVTGVEDAVFCHKKRFLVVAMSKEGALRLAKLAVDA